MKKLSTVFILTIIIAAGIVTGVLIVQNTNNKPLEKKTAPQVLSDKTQPTQPDQPIQTIQNPTPGAPISVSIPSINVQANIEQVGLDSEGRMDVPRTHYTVAWYSLGFKPGQNGNAVLAGHLDRENGDPAVFWNVPKLKAGDTIIVTDDTNKQYKFAVTRIQEYPYNNFPLNEVFGESDKPQLNLITCNGEWDNAQKNYSHRTVIYSELIE